MRGLIMKAVEIIKDGGVGNDIQVLVDIRWSCHFY